MTHASIIGFLRFYSQYIGIAIALAAIVVILKVLRNCGVQETSQKFLIHFKDNIFSIYKNLII